jgi:hypothetical protein
VIAAFIAAKFVLYCGFFYLSGIALQIGVPLDALRAAFHRTWLGAAATMVCLVAYMILRMSGASFEANHLAGTGLMWVLRLAIWVWVTTRVYRVTRWRKGKLAAVTAAGLALEFAVDFGLTRLQESHPFMPVLGEWEFRLC